MSTDDEEKEVEQSATQAKAPSFFSVYAAMTRREAETQAVAAMESSSSSGWNQVFLSPNSIFSGLGSRKEDGATAAALSQAAVPNFVFSVFWS